MVTVNLKNLNKKRKIDLSEIEKLTKKVLNELKLKNAEVNIVFFGNQGIRALNRRYLKKDRATDVIAFPSSAEMPSSGKKHFLGDIAISSDKAMQNAGVYDTSFTKELVLYVAHGILHLVGYKDLSKKDRRKMREKENELLQKIAKGLS